MVEENTFAVASVSDGESYLFTGELYDCKAIIAYDRTAQKAVMAHVSCVSQLDSAVGTILSAIDTEPADLEITIATGSRYDVANDIDAPVWDEEDLVYPSTHSIRSALQTQGAYNIARAYYAIQNDDSLHTRAVAFNLSDGTLDEVDNSREINWDQYDDSKNQVIEPKIL